MGLLPTLNTYKTEDNVRNFLIKEFPRLVIMAGYSMVDVKSPRFSATPKSTSVGNGVENNMVGHIDAPRIVDAVILTIKHCPADDCTILTMAYIQGLKDEIIIDRVPYERSQYYKLKSAALRYFADGFTKMYDLHVYENRTESGLLSD